MQRFMIARNLTEQNSKDLDNVMRNRAPAWIMYQIKNVGGNKVFFCYVDDDREDSFRYWYANVYDTCYSNKPLLSALTKPTSLGCMKVSEVFASAKKFIFKGKKVMAKTRKEAIAKIVASVRKEKVLASSVSESIKNWIKTTFAGVFDNYSLENGDEEFLNKDFILITIAEVLIRYFRWSDKDNKFYLDNDAFNTNDFSAHSINKIEKFKDIDSVLYNKYSEDVADKYELCTKAISRRIRSYMNEQGFDSVDLFDDVIQRLVDNVPANYHEKEFLHSEWNGVIFVNATNPEFMKAVFGTNDVAEIVKGLVDRKYSDSILKAFEEFGVLYKKPTFETVLLSLSKKLGSLKFKYRSKVTLQEILSVKEPNNTNAVDKIYFNGTERNFRNAEQALFLVDIGNSSIAIDCSKNIETKPSSVDKIQVY